MKAIKSLIISGGLVMASFTGYAQLVPGASDYHEQALLFGQYEYTGTARFQGIGGTQISLGGDITSTVGNPAGLGFYNRSEVSLTPSLNFASADAVYFNSSVKNTKTKFNFDNLGVVFNKTMEEDNLLFLQSRSFAISYSKVNDFNNIIEYEGDNTQNNIIDYAIQDAMVNQGNPEIENLSGFARDAYDSYLISEFFDAYQEGTDTTFEYYYDRTFFNESPRYESPTHQTERIESSGSQNQLSVAYGGNVSDRFYFGFNLGIMSINYRMTKFYDELYPDRDIGHSLLLTDELDVEGIGINGSLGFIARPVNTLLVGASFITPTAYNLNEFFVNNFSVNYNSYSFENYDDYKDDPDNEKYFTNNRRDDYLYTGIDYNESTTLNEEILEPLSSEFQYNITTPWRVNGGATYFFGKTGFISADIQYVDYSTMKVKAVEEDGLLDYQNDIIEDNYGSAINWKVGGELRFDKYRARAGFAYFDSPYVSGDQADNARYNISLGGGLRTGDYFIDLAIVNKYYKTSYAPYTLDGSQDYLQTPYASITNTNLNIVVSGGFFF